MKVKKEDIRHLVERGEKSVFFFIKIKVDHSQEEGPDCIDHRGAAGPDLQIKIDWQGWFRADQKQRGIEVLKAHQKSDRPGTDNRWP